jgi:SAM-dependent methyltransferase
MADLQVSIVLSLAPRTAFDTLVAELQTALARLGLTFEAGPKGRITEGPHVVGSVTAWTRGKGLSLEWHPAPWASGKGTTIDLKLAPVKGGTRATLTHRGWGAAVGSKAELAGWFAGEVAAPLLRATAPSALGDWITDRRARRPAGAEARTTYGDPIFHYPNFHVILDELALGPNDFLLEVACGGGALLKRALESGCRAAAIDYSADMVRLAQEANRDAIAAGRLEIREADAAALPFADATFTCAAMTGVLGFLPDPVRVLGEIRRVLKSGGRLVALGTDPELKGTPAAPEPIASRLKFYDSAALEALGRQAGFAEVRVIRRDLEPYAREAGVPAYALPLFAGAKGGGARFLLAGKG